VNRSSSGNGHRRCLDSLGPTVRRRIGLEPRQPPPPNLEDLAGRIRAPIFYIYAERGAGGEENNPQYYAATHAAKQLWLIKTTHTHGLAARPAEYERRVVGFFDRALRPD
jgi:hypothetical protein